MNILFPGRHHLLTDFQFKYLYRLIETGLHLSPDVNGDQLSAPTPVTSIIFPVTSANHSNTRRNPIPFHLRALALQDFAQSLGVPVYIFPIDDVGHLEDFAGYTLKKIRHDSEGLLDLTPENTVVGCSSPVLHMYEALGFRVYPVELQDKTTGDLLTASPWDLVERLAKIETSWDNDPELFDLVHPASFRIWSRYGLLNKVEMLFSDDMIGADGDLTESRDYNSYVREMDEIAEMKYRETAPYLRPGRIGDIGCAVGTWIKLAASDPKLRESDFIGIEVAFHLYRICLQQKENGLFPHPYVFFAQKNAVTGLCFDRNSMNTIHTSSLTHEIESYGNREDLLQFIRNRFAELAPGGVWVNRDVIGPDDPDKKVLLRLNQEDGRNEDWEEVITEREALTAYLGGLSTRALFHRFVRDFRREEGYQFQYEWVETDGVEYVATTLAQAMEFISKKNYHSNWQSEMHESFCFWSFADWKRELEEVGFYLNPNSKAYTNNWLVQNRYRGNADLFEHTEAGWVAMAYPVTHALIVAEKRI